MNTITGDEVIANWQRVWPYGGVEYSQSKRHEPDKIRQDCSGAVTGMHGGDLDGPGTWGGYSTVSMVTMGLWSPLASWDDLRKGDDVGIMGAGTGGNDGHVMTFEAWLNDNPNDSRAYIWEQAGGGGPARRLVDLAAAARQGYRPYRYKGMVDGAGPTPEPSPPSGGGRPWPSYMPFNQWFGDINGPNASHGGYYANERGDVAQIQVRLAALGYTEVGAADGEFGPKTIAAVSRWQRERYAELTTYYGQVWADDWSRLFA